MMRFLIALLLSSEAYAAAPEVLPGSAVWNFPADIVAQQYSELRTFYERGIDRAAKTRRPPSDPQRARSELRKLLGAIDDFLPPRAQTEPLSDFGKFTAVLVEWPILRSGNEPPTVGSAGTMVREYGILLMPKSSGPHPAVIAISDADQSAADIAGLTQRLPDQQQSARILAAGGSVVFAPFFTQRRAFSEPWTDDRSWLFRLAYQTGHHLLGSEVQQISSAYEYLKSLPEVDATRISVAGSGQGGLIAFYAAALDERISTASVSNYLSRHERPYDEPEDRLVWKLLVNFGDAEIASLIAPRPLLRESNQMATSGQPAKADRLMDPDRIAQIANAQFSQWQARYRNLALEAYATREAAWKADTSSIEAYQRWSQPKPEQYFDLIGRYPEPSAALEAKSIRLYDEDEFTGYRLSVPVYEGVNAYGIILVPKGIQTGERRPVVFTQHGLRGTPESALGVIPNKAADDVYSRFGMRLARRGYIVFAPMISTQDSVERDRLTRRAHLLGQTPVGMEVKKFGRVLDYLSTLPFVDKERFAFYGLSYGGYTALWSGPGEQRFKVIISSGHFNDWDIKTTDPTQGTSFLFYRNNFDMFNFDLLNRFSHAELGMLVAPRAFMVEVGDRDGVVVAPRRFPVAEMRRVEDLYIALGIPDRGRIARFHGPHKVDGTEAFAFLDHWLNWTARN